MRGPGERARKYGAKVRGLVIPGQKKRFRGAVGDQVEAELFVKGLGVPALYQNYYMIFAKQVLKIRQTHAGDLAQDEVCVAFTRWDSRGLTDTVLDSIVTHYNFDSCITPAPPTCDWDFKMKITFSGNVSATNLDDFPVLVHLTGANFDFNHAQNNGEDIRFMDSDTCPTDGTPLKHEIEKWDKAGTDAWVWVKVPRIDGGSVADFIYMFFDNGAVADGQDVPNVWDANFETVVHLPDETATSVKDSTVTGNTGNKIAVGQPLEAPAMAAQGQDFDGINDAINFIGYCVHNDTSYTAETWFRLDSGFNCAVVPSVIFQEAKIAIRSCWSNTIQIAWMDGSGWRGLSSGMVSVANTWFYVVQRYDAATDTMEIWVDGVLKNTYGLATVPVHGAGTKLVMGGQGKPTASAMYHPGEIDETRISESKRSGDWIMATYRTVQETLLTFGAEEAS